MGAFMKYRLVFRTAKPRGIFLLPKNGRYISVIEKRSHFKYKRWKYCKYTWGILICDPPNWRHSLLIWVHSFHCNFSIESYSKSSLFQNKEIKISRFAPFVHMIQQCVNNLSMKVDAQLTSFSFDSAFGRFIVIFQ